MFPTLQVYKVYHIITHKHVHQSLHMSFFGTYRCLVPLVQKKNTPQDILYFFLLLARDLMYPNESSKQEVVLVA